MKRRTFLEASTVILGTGSLNAHLVYAAKSECSKQGMTVKAGFARVSITPPLGTKMMGFGTRDMEHGCKDVHDDLHVRALFLEQGEQTVLIMGYDLCFLGREETDRYRGAIGRVLDLHPEQIIMNTSHNHVGPSVGTWYSAGYEMPDRLYLDQLERATVAAALEARKSMREVTLWTGVTRSALPMNRRRKMDHGGIENRPNPDGYVYDKLPICLFKDSDGKPVCLLFSVSCHPSMMSGFDISAEYPGAAMRLLDKHLGAACSLFLQGVGGDAKPSVIGRGGVDRWQPGTWELMEEAGAMIANETIETLNSGLLQIEPDILSASVEMSWPLEPAPPRSHFEKIVADTAPENRPKNVRYTWAKNVLERLDLGYALPTSVTLSAQGVQLGNGLRIIGIEGEATAPWGKFIEDFYGNGLTVPLGYCNGTGLYLPTSDMLPEGGYEVVSFWEYGLPSQLAPGMEEEVHTALVQLRDRGIT
ncbi:MAG: hypothetical protein ABIH23_15265 [bacterium]